MPRGRFQVTKPLIIPFYGEHIMLASFCDSRNLDGLLRIWMEYSYLLT